MPVPDLTTEQVIQLVRQLPPERKREILLALASDAAPRRAQRMQDAEAQLRKVCAARGLNWDTMSEEERERLADDLIHEDRPCHK
jgi:TRAP-type C4-dicarboxylate transport system substrate-binding protein